VDELLYQIPAIEDTLPRPESRQCDQSRTRLHAPITASKHMQFFYRSTLRSASGQPMQRGHDRHSGIGGTEGLQWDRDDMWARHRTMKDFQSSGRYRIWPSLAMQWKECDPGGSLGHIRLNAWSRTAAGGVVQLMCRGAASTGLAEECSGSPLKLWRQR